METLAIENRICEALLVGRPELTEHDRRRRAQVVFADANLLARCARTKCLITYTSAIAIRGHGNPQSGDWLDDVYKYFLATYHLPDLTLLVVNKTTSRPSPGAFHEGRMRLSGVRTEDVRPEQRRAIEYDRYEDYFSYLEPIPAEQIHATIFDSIEIEHENGISRAVENALGRIRGAGVETVKVGRTYLDSLSADKLRALARRLMREQNGRCALTGTPFDEASEVDRVSLDRIDCDRGYSEGNVQLTTVFANRARGTLDPKEAQLRLVQWSETCQY